MRCAETLFFGLIFFSFSDAPHHIYHLPTHHFLNIWRCQDTLYADGFTPKVLCIQVVGNVSEARSSLVWYRGRTDVEDDINEMERERQSHSQEAPFTWRELFGRNLRRPLTIVIMLQVRLRSYQ